MGSVAQHDSPEVVVALRDMLKATRVAVDGLVVLKRHKESISLLLEMVSRAGFLDRPSLNDNLGVGLSSTGSLEHFRLSGWLFHLLRSGVGGGNDF